MSWQASSWAKRIKAGSPARKAVLMIIAEHTDQWGYAWAGQQLIADEAEVGIRSVQRYTSKLARAGILTIYQARERDGRIRNLYRLNFESEPKDDMPGDHPSLSGRYKLFTPSGPDEDEDQIGDPAANSASGPPANLAAGQPPIATEPAANSDGASRHQMAAEPTRTTKEPGALAREAPPAERVGGASPVASEEDQARWRAVVEQLGKEAGEDAVRSWVKPLLLARTGGGPAVVCAPTRFIRDWVLGHYADRIAALWGGPIEFRVGVSP